MTTQPRRPTRNTQSRKGVMVALVCFMLVVIFGTIAFVGDLGNVIVVRTTLGAAADAAALAGAGAMAQSYSLDEVKPIAVEYGLANVPEHYGDVLDQASITFGTWNPETHTFTPTNLEPNAVRVIVERTAARGNEVPYFFAKIFGFGSTEIAAEAIAVGANSTTTPLNDGRSVYVTSTKELSNVVLDFGPDEDGNLRHQKFDGLSGYTGNYEGVGDYEGLNIVGVWIKSGCNASGDGPGYGVYIPSDYGEHIDHPGDGFTSHGDSKNKGCIPHVTATFEAAPGVEFTESGSYSPVRLVK